MTKTQKIFNICSESGANKYKIYAWFLDGKIIYIGITKTTLFIRLTNHENNAVGYKRLLLNECISSGKKINVEILFSFQSRMIACISERVLINFCKKFINTDLINFDTI
jgi:hypothetical protein